jgi:hypothetical protein
MAHLFLAVTAHGYGHLAQVAPVVVALAERLPNLRVSLQSDIDPSVARGRLPPGFRHLQEPTDVGLLMDGPFTTRWEESVLAYEAFEANYERRLRRQREIFEQDPPDLVLADVPWLPLQAALIMGIPAVALCSLNWFDILSESPVADRFSPAPSHRIKSTYTAADLFIRPAPSMPMTWLPNARGVGPIAQLGANRTARIRGRLGLPEEHRMVLVQFGGVGGFDPMTKWPPIPDVHWLVTRDEGRGRADVTRLSQLGISVLDALATSDAVVTKAGYGSVTEAACHGVPVLSVSRSDWPEERWLVGWLRERVPTREITLSDLLAGRIEEPLRDLCGAGRAVPVEPTGAAESADLLATILARRRSR